MMSKGGGSFPLASKPFLPFVRPLFAHSEVPFVMERNFHRDSQASKQEGDEISTAESDVFSLSLLSFPSIPPFPGEGSKEEW